jgi:hypothetical protein
MAIVTDEGKTRLIVTGDDTFNDRKLMRKKLQKLTFSFEGTVVCVRGLKDWDPASGKWIGAEELAQEWAHKRKHLVMIFWPDPKVKKKKQARMRDKEILDYATHCVVFWDGYNESTEEFIKQAKKKGLKVKVVKYD